MARRPPAITAISLFFVFGATMSGLAALMLLFPHSPLTPLWRLNPDAGVQLGQLGALGIFSMAAVSTSCVVAALGLWRLRDWGFKAALYMLAVNLLGDLLTALVRHDGRTLIGLPIAGAMIFYLVRCRALFDSARN